MNVLSSSFVEHGRELKQRAWHVLLSLGMSFATCFFFRQEILHRDDASFCWSKKEPTVSSTPNFPKLS